MKRYILFLFFTLSLNSFAQIVQIAKTSSVDVDHLEYWSTTNYTWKVDDKLMGGISVDLRNRTCQFALVIDEHMRYFDLLDQEDNCMKIYDAVHDFADALPNDSDFIEMRFQVETVDRILLNSIMIINNGLVSFTELNLENL